jgi:hypothetical protein
MTAIYARQSTGLRRSSEHEEYAMDSLYKQKNRDGSEVAVPEGQEGRHNRR